jgi:dihydroneopterin aldolase
MTPGGEWMLADVLGIERRAEPGPPSRYRIFVRDLVLQCRIGVYEEEQHGPQRVRINAEVLVERGGTGDEPRDVVDYARIVEGIRGVAGAGHINLVETFAERVLDLCLADPRALAARVGIEKLDIVPDAESVGVWLKRGRRRKYFRA